MFQPLGWGPAGGGDAVAVPGDPCISAFKRPGFVKCLESPWKYEGTRRRAPGVGWFSGRALRPLSDPGPAAGPVGSCSPQAVAARGAEDAGRRRSPPPTNLLARGGERWGGAVAPVIGGGLLQPPPKSPPPLAASDSEAPARQGGDQASARAAAPPRAPAAPAPRRDRRRTHPPTEPRSRGIPEEWVMAGRAVGLFSPGWDVHLRQSVSLGGAQ